MSHEFNILIIDDDPLMRTHLENFLISLGYKIFSQKDNYESFINNHSLEINLILYNLPYGPNSLENIKNLHDQRKDIPIILLVDFEQIPQMDRMGEEANQIEIIKKPLNFEELSKKIGEIADRDPLKKEFEDPSLVNGMVGKDSSHLLYGKSKKIEEIRMVIEQVSKTDITVLIGGESGTGKELVARTIYNFSLRSNRPFIKVLCAAIPDGLLESELFGYEKGSFTGAHRSNPGKFEFANKGTIFLDEIGDIPLSLQAKLLQVLQDGEFSRLGGNEIKVDTRIIVATNKKLDVAVREGTFREDLFYRLNVVSINLPPLRERKEDIPLLIDLFIKKNSEQFNQEKKEISSHILKQFLDYDWPGNVRELENLMKRIVVLGEEEAVVKDYFREKEMAKKIYETGNNFGENVNEGSTIVEKNNGESWGFSLKETGKAASRKAEGELIKRVLEDTHWNRKETAKLLGVSYKALLYKIKGCYLNE